MKYLISPDRKQYKANLHCHSVLSDGKKTPEELKEMYKSHGYSILAITDHERPMNHQRLAEKDFIMLTGYECYIRPDPNASYDIYAPEIHLNLFARDPENVGFVGYNEHYAKYLRRDNALADVVKVGSERTREYTTEYINFYISEAKKNGYIVAYNHPFWSMESEERILSYEGLFSLEISNYGSYLINHEEHAGEIYDKLLRSGRRIFCHGADDNHNTNPEGHPVCDSFGSFTMIMPEELSYSSVFEAMEKGEMYSSMGPTFKEISVEGDTVHIECSEVSHIFMYMGSKTPRYLHARDGESMTSADLKIHPEAKYIRISIRDEKGRWADTRGFSVEELL